VDSLGTYSYRSACVRCEYLGNPFYIAQTDWEGPASRRRRLKAPLKIFLFWKDAFWSLGAGTKARIVGPYGKEQSTGVFV